MKVLNKALALIAIVASFSSSAELVTVNQWHETGDNFGGFKQSNFSQDVFFAVGDQDYFSRNNSYEIMNGYRIATFEEYVSILNEAEPGFSGSNTYYNQGGWSGYNFNGQHRVLFTFLDSQIGDEVIHAGNPDNYLGSVVYSDNQLNSSWAGFVLVKDSSSGGGVYDFSTSNFVSSDVPVPIMFSALGLGLIGFSKRKKPI